MRYAKVRFGDVERVDLLKAWIATSIAFGIYFLAPISGQSPMTFVLAIALAAVTAGLGFIAHELMHKLTANHFGVEAEFRSNDTMLSVSILLAFFGVILAAPGAVQIYGHITRRENGIISAAGPAANMVLAALFLPLAMLSNPLLAVIGSMGLLVNAILGVFNMIPILNFDGSKIFKWNKIVYFSMVIVGCALVAVAYFVGKGL